MPLRGGFEIPLPRARQIARHAFTRGVQGTEVELRNLVAAHPGAREPSRRLARVARHALALEITLAEHPLRLGEAEVGRALKLVDCLRVIRRVAKPVVIVEAQVVMHFGVVLFDWRLSAHPRRQQHGQ